MSKDSGDQSVTRKCDLRRKTDFSAMEWVFSSLACSPVNFVLVNFNLKMPAEHLPFCNNYYDEHHCNHLINHNAPTLRPWLLWHICFVPYMKYKSLWLLSLRFYSRIWFSIGFPSWDETSVTSWILLLKSVHWSKLHSRIAQRSFSEPCMSKVAYIILDMSEIYPIFSTARFLR